MLHADLDRARRSSISLQSQPIDSSAELGRRSRDRSIHPTTSAGERAIHSRSASAGSIRRSVPSTPIIKQFDIPPGNDLFQPPIGRVTDLNKVIVEQNEKLTIKTGRAGASHEFHHHPSTDIPVPVDVDCTLVVADEELGLAKAEHAEGFEVRDAAVDASQISLCVGLVGVLVGDRVGLLFVKG